MNEMSEYTLKACIDALRRMDGDLLEYGYHLMLADRIEELTAVEKRTSTTDERPVYSDTAPHRPGDKILG